MSRALYSEKELKDILRWRKNRMTPEKLFGLDEFDNKSPYDATQVTKICEKLKFKSHPIKYQSTHYLNEALQVFQLLEQAKDFLLFKINAFDKPIVNLDHNIFYLYYVLKTAPIETPEDKYEFFIRSAFDSYKRKASISEQLMVIRDLLKQYPHFIYNVYDEKLSPYELVDKNIFYLAVQWNEPLFLMWLLERFSDEENLLKKTSFDYSPLDYAIYHHHFDILICLKQHFGDEWFKNNLKAYLYSKEPFDRADLISFYLQQYPEEFVSFLNSPLLIPGLIKLGIIEDKDLSVLRLATIYCPQVYLIIEKSIRAQLSLGFSVALADHFPILKNAVKSTFHPDSPPYHNYVNYNQLIGGVELFLISISLGLLFWYFLPFMVLLPDIMGHLVSLLVMSLVVSLVLSFVSVSTVFCIYSSLSYFSKIYPETQKINSTLSHNSIFQVPLEKVTLKSEDFSNISSLLRNQYAGQDRLNNG